MKKQFLHYLGILVFSLLISFPLLIPYLHPGYFPTHDGEWAVVRLADMFREIRDLQIPPRFSDNLNFGYGYPLFNFAYPFPYYLGIIIHQLGFGFVNTIKIIFATSVPLSAFFMFLASRNIWKNDYAGIVSSVLYVYFPYRLVDLFVRGSIGESVAFTLFPMILLCLSKLNDNPKSMWFRLAGGILFASLILTHNIMAVLFSITFFIFFLSSYLIHKRKIIFPYLFVVILGFILSAFFFLPALLEKNNILLSRIPISDRSLYFVNIKQLLFSKWGYGIPTDPNNGFTYQIGWPFLLILVFCLAYFAYLFYKKRNSREQRLEFALLIGTLLFSLLLFSFSSPFWRLPLLSEINYPWIVLSQFGLLVSVLAGFLARNKISRYVGLLIAIFAIFLYLPFAKPEKYFDKGDGYYFTNDATTTSSNELMPLWVKKFPIERQSQKVETLHGNATTSDLVYSSKKISFSANALEDSILRINTIYYPGWKIYVDGKNVSVSYENSLGVMDFNLTRGTHSVLGIFSETNPRIIADLISVAGVIFVVTFFSKTYIFKRRRK